MKTQTWVVLALVAMGCGKEEGAISGSGSTLALTEDFVAVPREFSEAERAGVKKQGLGNPGETFYIAVRRSELGKTYFLSAYLKQLFPLFTPPAFTLGTKVVTFEVQNGRLLVFDVDKRKKSSETFNADVAIEAYDLVTTSSQFNGSHNSSQYVLFDPASGLNRFGVVSQTFSDAPGWGGKFSTDLLFSQRFRSLSDGVQFDQAFAGHFDEPLPYNDGSIQQNTFLLNGTVSVALRKYKESPGFTSFPQPETPYFFESERLIVPNTGTVDVLAARWNIKPGMAPIKWVISSRLDALAADPRYSKYDLRKAVKDGIENWNLVFGFKAFEASIGSSNTESGDDEKNVLVIDEDPTFGFAFADWRTNPNTGEIRGASVYFNAGWFDYAKSLFDPAALSAPETAAVNALVARTTQARVDSFVWNGLTKKRDVRKMGARLIDLAHQRDQAAAALAALTEKEQLERFITHVILHEIGHTLSLRHNFKGSLVPPSSSVMEYVDDFDAVNVAVPQAYDTAAVKYLYGQSTTEPTQPFCTDDGIGASDATCAPFDLGTDPLADYFAPNYDYYLQRYLSGQSNSTGGINYYLGGVLDYVRAAATPADRERAWNLAVASVKPNLAAGTVALFGQRADLIQRSIWGQTFLGRVANSSNYVTLPPNDLALRAAMHAQLKNEILNSDGFRAAVTSRQGIDVLKLLQTNEAYRALVEARNGLLALRLTATGDAALALDDQIARANSALSPYFK